MPLLSWLTLSFKCLAIHAIRLLRTLLALHFAVHHDACFQIASDHIQDRLVFDFLANFMQQKIMVDFIEKRGDVYIHYPAFALLNIGSSH